MVSVEKDLLQLSRRCGGPLLAFDSSGPVAAVCTVAWQPGRVRELQLPSDAMPSEALADCLAREGRATKCNLADLCGIVVGLGPGSFTGLRVSLALAKGIGLATAVPLFGCSSLALLAAGYGPGPVVVARDARHGDWFTALYDVDVTGQVHDVLSDAARTAEGFVSELRDYLHAEPAVVGDAAELCAEQLGVAVRSVEPKAVPRVGLGLLQLAERICTGDADSLDALAPRYMRLSAAERLVAGHA